MLYEKITIKNLVFKSKASVTMPKAYSSGLNHRAENRGIQELPSQGVINSWNTLLETAVVNIDG